VVEVETLVLVLMDLEDLEAEVPHQALLELLTLAVVAVVEEELVVQVL
tara:strand:- start:176 stop:319 length:144 start_codon:yes stop_codon:yes gene_type:complete